MAGPFDFTGQNIENTYQRVLQTDGIFIYDGTGSLVNINISGSPAIDTSSFATTGSNQFNGNQSISGTLHQSGTFYPDQIDWFSSSIGYDTGSYILTTTNNGLTTYANYPDVANELSQYITVTSASHALTASYVNPLHQNVILTGSLLVTQSHISTVDYIDFTILPTPPAFNTGRLHWIDDTKTLQLDTDVNGFELEIGHQSVIRGRNVNSFTLTKGTVVYINGESGNRPTFATASWEGDPSSATTIGIIAQSINSNQTGYAVTNGLIRDVNTNAFSPGTSLYLSSSGQYTDTPPLSPLHEVRLGKTITQATNGIIYIDIQNGYELGELHDVLITSASNGDLISWDSGSNVWKNTKQLTGSYGLTGSLNATSFTGSLYGTSSWANNALTSSYVQIAQTASYVLNAVSASYASTASYVNGIIIKNNEVTGGSFSGNPKKYTVTFATAFPNTNYSVTITGEDSRSWTIESKLAGSFVISSNSNTTLSNKVYWQAISYGEFNS